MTDNTPDRSDPTPTHPSPRENMRHFMSLREHGQVGASSAEQHPMIIEWRFQLDTISCGARRARYRRHRERRSARISRGENRTWTPCCTRSSSDDWPAKSPVRLPPTGSGWPPPRSVLCCKIWPLSAHRRACQAVVFALDLPGTLTALEPSSFALNDISAITVGQRTSRTRSPGSGCRIVRVPGERRDLVCSPHVQRHRCENFPQLVDVGGGEKAERAPLAGLQRRSPQAPQVSLNHQSRARAASRARTLATVSADVPSGTCVVIVTRYSASSAPSGRADAPPEPNAGPRAESTDFPVTGSLGCGSS
jgi:hypothetical protein